MYLVRYMPIPKYSAMYATCVINATVIVPCVMHITFYAFVAVYKCMGLIKHIFTVEREYLVARTSVHDVVHLRILYCTLYRIMFDETQVGG